MRRTSLWTLAVVGAILNAGVACGGSTSEQPKLVTVKSEAPATPTHAAPAPAGVEPIEDVPAEVAEGALGGDPNDSVAVDPNERRVTRGQVGTRRWPFRKGVRAGVLRCDPTPHGNVITFVWDATVYALNASARRDGWRPATPLRRKGGPSLAPLVRLARPLCSKAPAASADHAGQGAPQPDVEPVDASVPEPPPPPDDLEPNEAWVTRAEMGMKWPFKKPIDTGIVRCDGSNGIGAVTFTAGGTTYAVNGLATSWDRGANIRPIWRNNPAADQSYGPIKVDMSPIVFLGLSLCA